MERLPASFFQQDVLVVAPKILNKTLFCKANNEIKSYKITEVEAYKGEKDLACHASKGRTKRTEIMYHEGGHIYVYLIYGMYWMLNFVTGVKDNPQALLIRGITGLDGPGKLTKALGIDKSFYGENLETSSRIWVADSKEIVSYKTTPRIGIDYAGEPWKSKKWRYIVDK
jgi:DNA-3-methyladenine glycosylase